MASHISQCTHQSRVECGTNRGNKKQRIPGADLKYRLLFVFFFLNESNNRPEIISIFALFRKRKIRHL